MANLAETTTWEPGIYQLEEEDLVQGGPDGIDNVQAKQLGNRTLYLKQQVESALGDMTAHLAAADPHGQYATEIWVAAQIAALINSAPGALDTLNELSVALGNDANFSATIANSLALKAPLSSPPFTGNPTAPTPAQFDNDTSVATSAFVQRALGNCRASYSKTGNVVLEAADIGCHVVAGNDSADRSYTMPDISALPEGASVRITNLSGKNITLVQRSGTDRFIGAFDGSGTGTSFTFGDRMSIVAKKYNGGMWLITGGGDDYKSSLFGSFLASSGYQKLPSGLIIQWGPIPAIAVGGNVVVTFPIAFPSALFAVSGIAGSFGGVNATLFDQNLVGAKFFNTQAGTVQSASGAYIAIGK